MVIERETVLLAVGGDRDAFGRLYEAVAGELYRVALYTLGNEQDAKDAVSDTFMDAYREISGLRDAERFRPWIFRILSAKCNRIVSGYIKERGNIDIDDYTGSTPESSADFGSGELAEAMSSLAPDERQMVLLSVLSGYTMREISEIMGVPPGTVSSKISRTMKKLRDRLNA